MEDCCAVRGNGKGGYDLAVIGAGSAGFSAAITAAEQGAQVALIGHGTIGGTCVNTGCVPSKTMIRAAETLHQAKSASRFRGIEAHAKVTDWRAVMAEKKALVEGLRQAKYVDLLPAYNSIAYLIERLRGLSLRLRHLHGPPRIREHLQIQSLPGLSLRDSPDCPVSDPAHPCGPRRPGAILHKCLLTCGA